MKDDLISVIVPIYNTEQYIEKCINSIVNQTYKDLEIILLNDGSTDNSKEICKKWSKMDSRIIFIDKANSGVSDTRNCGIDISKGKYISFVDSDDFLEPMMYEEMLKSIKENNSDLSTCGIFLINGSKKEQCLYNYPNNMKQKDFFRTIIKKNVTLWNKLFKKEIIGNLRFDTDISISEDEVFLYKYLEKANNISNINKPLYNYNQSNLNSALNIHDSKKYITSIKADYYICKILEKYNFNERYNIQANCVCNYVIYKKNIGKNFNYEEYDKIIKGYMDNNLLFKVKGIKNKVKVFFAYYLKDIYLLFKTIKSKKVN